MPIRLNEPLLSFARTATLIAAALVISSCATAGSADKAAQVRVYNYYRNGIEPPPTTLDGCEPLGRVTATPPKYQGQTVALYDPRDLLPVIRGRAASKSADTVVVSMEPGPQREPFILIGTAFRCGGHPVPAELGEPLQ
jgi:hypothetical protein